MAFGSPEVDLCHFPHAFDTSDDPAPLESLPSSQGCALGSGPSSQSLERHQFKPAFFELWPEWALHDTARTGWIWTQEITPLAKSGGCVQRSVTEAPSHGWGLDWIRGRERGRHRGPALTSFCFMTVDAMGPVVSCFCFQVFPSTAGCTSKQGAPVNRLFLS